MDEQRYDVFLHVYVSTPFGDRRLGFKRYQTKALLIRNGWDPEPQWLTFTPDAENKEDVSMFTAQIQMKLLFGTRKEIDLFEPKRVHTKIPKLMRYEITANIFQGKDLQPADENGLSDPYVKVVMAGIERETAIIERTLQPIWYQRLTIPIDLPRDLNLAPKITLLVFDSDPFLGMKLNDPIIGFCQCPPEPITPDPDPDAKPRTMKEYFVRSGMGNDIQPEWVELFSNEGMEALAAHRADPIVNERPLNVGQLLVSFEIRPQQDALKIALQDAEDAKAARIEQARKQAEESGKKPNPLLEIMPAPKINYIRTMPKMIPCYLEVALVGVRDMRPISVAGIKKPVTAPYIEFEYGHRLAPERYWKTKTMVAGGGSSTGPNANFLEVIYLQVSLPDDPLYDPVMGVRVRDAAAGLPAVPGMPGFEPICGVASVPIKEKLPSFARHEKERIAREEEEEKERLRRIEAEDARKAEEGEVDLPDPPTAENEEVLEEFIFESTAGGGGGSRSVPDPDAQELGDSDDDSEDEDDEGEEGGKKEEGEPIITHPMESTLKDIPFESHKLHLGANKPTLQMGGIAFGSKRTVGILKMQLRVIEEENFLETIKSEPAPKLKAVFKEEMTKVRVHVYWATNLSVREDGKAPAPFLKVYNGTAAHQIKTTRNKSGNTTNPEFWTSFELAAMLPGDSQLKIEVWDYTILREMLIGGTTIDLEDRYYSKKWKEMQANEEVPRELRQLFTEASTNVQGNIIFKLQIFPAKFAKANPMEGLAPPKKTPMELRVVVWEAKDVATKDGGRSDVFITIQPRGESEYEKQSTDTHWFSTGEAEFNWRMIWPVFLPEKVPRLFMQVWDQDIIGADDAIGEAELNLKAMYDKALKKTMGQKQNGIWVDCHHPNFKGAQARVRLSIEVLTLPESLIKPAGRERNAPNENPYLEAPIRPGLFDGMGLAFNFSLINFGMLKKYLVRCCICCIIVGVIAGVVALQVM